MYGRIGKLKAQAGRRSELVTILIRAAEIVGEMPGCHLYVVNEDLTDENTIWVIEVWADKEAHTASLQDEQVRALIQEAMPLMGGPPEGIEMNVVGGHGLKG
jgi:quinol monooxygenase YgiN